MRIEATEIGETKGQPATDTLRRCAVMRVQRPKDDLIRFVLGPDGTVVPDLKEKLPGRGVCVVAIIDYKDNDLGDYNEVSIALFVRPRGERDECQIGNDKISKCRNPVT